MGDTPSALQAETFLPPLSSLSPHFFLPSLLLLFALCSAFSAPPLCLNLSPLLSIIIPNFWVSRTHNPALNLKRVTFWMIIISTLSIGAVSALYLLDLLRRKDFASRKVSDPITRGLHMRIGWSFEGGKELDPYRSPNQVRFRPRSIFFVIIISIFSFSNPSLFLVDNNHTGDYLYPESSAFVEQHIVHSPLYPFLLMANNTYENSLILRESEIFEVEDEPAPELDKALSLTLAGKLLTNSRPSLANLAYFTSKQWECLNRVKAFDHGNGLYTFEFSQDSDVLRAVTGGPWFVEGKLLLLQKINPLLSINQLVFESTKLWVRCYNLPPKVFNMKFAKEIGNMLGVFCDVDLFEDGDDRFAASRIPIIRKFLRIKVLLKLKVPLKRYQSFKIKNSEANTVDTITAKLAYERLPIFCYCCGLLGHDSDSCSSGGPIIYEESIRAEKYNRSHLGSSHGNASATQANNEFLAPVSMAASVENTNPVPVESNIILANFRSYREEGNLPPLPPSYVTPQFGSINNAIIPLSNSVTGVINPDNYHGLKEAVNNVLSLPMCADTHSSILGAPPEKTVIPTVLHSSITNPTYYNPMVSNSDLFATPSKRCLFKSDFDHPALSLAPKSVVTSPPELSPIHSSSEFIISPPIDKNGDPAPKQDCELQTSAPLDFNSVASKFKGNANLKGKRQLMEGPSKKS